MSNLFEILEKIDEKRSEDYLGISKDPFLLSTFEEPGEIVRWTDIVTEMNWKKKAQKRTLVLSTHAIYLYFPVGFKNIVDRIALENVTCLIFSEDADDMIIKCENGGFDRWIRSKRRDRLAKAIDSMCSRLLNEHLNAKIVPSSKLQSLIYTKEVSDNAKAANEARMTMIATSPKSAGGMANIIRTLVSKKKFRYQKDGYDLDLTYITDNIIAMGFPSEGSEGLYRNPLCDVVKLLEEKHEGKYRVYNLCSERSYNTAVFHGRVGLYPFDDHNCPEFRLIYELCKDASDWIQKDPKNIVAIHCKAGKGRTGLMISCLLLYMNMCKTYSEALELFGTQRTSNGKGVTIPSQKRYVEYFSQFLQNFKLEPLKFQFQGIPLVLTNIRISTVPRVTKDKGCDLYVEIRDVKGRKIYDSRKTVKPKHSKDEDYIDIPCVASIRGDVKLFFYHAEEFSRRNPLVFQLWLNTSFIEENYLKLSKSQIDKAIKDTEHKKFSENFSVELYFRPDDLITVEELRSKSVQSEEFQIDQTLLKIKESELELADLLAQREQLEDDIEQALEDNKLLREETDSLKIDTESKI